MRRQDPDEFIVPNLAWAAKQLVWDAAKRGPLLIIGAENSEPLPEDKLPPKPRLGWSPAAIGPFYERKLARLATVTALIPEKMVVLNTTPGKPDLLAGISRAERLMILLSLLDKDQWSALAKDGLGLGDMADDTQKEAFLAALPLTLPLRELRMGADSVWEGIALGKQPLSVWSQARIQLRRTISVSLSLRPAEGQESGGGSVNVGLKETKPGTRRWQLDNDSEVENKDDSFGQKIRLTLDNRSKPSALDFKSPALSVGVSVAGVKTVTELVVRLARATRLPLSVDPRYAALSVQSFLAPNQTIRAGDVLQALCLSVCATIRKLSEGTSTVFHLTDDLEGLSVRMGRLRLWQRRATQKKDALLAKAKERFDATELPKGISFGSDQVSTNPDLQRLAADPERFQLPLSRLPSKLQSELQATAEQLQKEGFPRLHAETVILSDRLSLSYTLPGKGIIAGGIDSLGSLLDSLTMRWRFSPEAPPLPSGIFPDPPQPTPGEGSRYSVLASAKSKEEVIQLVSAVAEQRIGTLFLEASPELLAQAVAVANDKLRIGALTRVFRAPTSTSAPDRNGLLLTSTQFDPIAEELEAWFSSYPADVKAGNWRVPDHPTTEAEVTARLQPTLSVPGLGAALLEDALPPGYWSNPESMYDREDPEAELGYTTTRRLAYLRSTGYDPTDLDSGGLDDINTELPFFGTGSTSWIEDEKGELKPDPKVSHPTIEWAKYRNAVLESTLTKLHTGLTRTHPHVAFFLLHRAGGAAWKRAKDRPPLPSIHLITLTAQHYLWMQSDSRPTGKYLWLPYVATVGGVFFDVRTLAPTEAIQAIQRISTKK